MRIDVYVKDSDGHILHVTKVFGNMTDIKKVSENFFGIQIHRNNKIYTQRTFEKIIVNEFERRKVC